MMPKFPSDIVTQWQTLPMLVQGSAETLGIILLAGLVRALFLKLVRRRISDQRTYFHWRKGTQYVTTLIVCILILSIWFQGAGNLATYLGLVSAGIAVALKDPLTNIIGWFYIMWQRPFGIGDRIEVGKIRGDVIDQRLLAFTMLEVGAWVYGDQSTGRLVHVPNAQVFAGSVINATQAFEFIWDEIAVVITFESDWAYAKTLFVDLLNARAEEIVPEARAELDLVGDKSLIQYHNLSPIVYTSVVDHGVRLTMRYLAPPRRRRLEQEKLWEGVLLLIAKHSELSLAYPTQRITGIQEHP